MTVRQTQMRRLLLAAVLVAISAASYAQPALRDLPPRFERSTEAKPGETCTSQNNKCLNFCDTQRSGAEAVSGCRKDCNWRVDYCKNGTGLYPWLRSNSVWVGKRE